MKRLIFGAMIVLVAGTAFGQEKWPIRQDIVQNPTTLTRLLSNRFGLVEADIADLQAASQGSGDIYYVSSVTGSDTYTGTDSTHPVATLNAAVALCTANNGDVIYALPGHNEALTAADGVDLDVAGITVIGCGQGSDRPRFDFDNADGEFVIGAAAVRIYGLTFLPSVTAVTHCIDIENAGDWAIIENCEFLEGEAAGTDEFVDCIQVGTTATNVTIRYNVYTNIGGTGPNNFIDLSAATISNPRIYCNVIKGEFAEAGIWAGAAVPTDVVCIGNVVENRTSGQFGIEFQGAATGVYGDNCVYADGATTAIDPGSMKAVAPNWIVTAIDKSPIMFPAQDDGATNMIGVDDNDNLASTSSVASNRDGSILERLEFLCKYFETGTAGALVAPADTRSMLDILGSDGTTTTGALAGSVLGAIGTDEASANTPFASTSVQDDADGSVLERLEHVQADTDKIDGVTLATAPTAASLASFIASGGVALGTQLATSKSLVDAIGSNGTALTDGAVSIAGILGIPTDADNLADSSTIASNRDGSVLERLEFLCKYFETGTPGALVAPASTFSLLDILGSDGSTTTGAVAGSILGAIGTNEATANTPFSSSTVAADADGSVLERLESLQASSAALPIYNGTNYLTVTVAFDGTTGAAHWGNAGETDEVLTVTGAVRIKLLMECTETCTGTDGGTIALWVATNEDIILAATTINTEGADNTNLDSGEIWLDTSPTEHSAVGTSGFFDFVVVGGLDVGLDCQTQDIADGTIVFHVWWTPLDATGNVAAGAGGTL